jgi:hypothetical protein
VWTIAAAYAASLHAGGSLCGRPLTFILVYHSGSCSRSPPATCPIHSLRNPFIIHSLRKLSLRAFQWYLFQHVNSNRSHNRVSTIGSPSSSAGRPRKWPFHLAIPAGATRRCPLYTGSGGPGSGPPVPVPGPVRQPRPPPPVLYCASPIKAKPKPYCRVQSVL